jgi:hypothetical protein
VLVAGGCAEPACPTALTTAELYDPSADRWLPAGEMSVGRAAHSATLLDDGSVLVAGGCRVRSCVPALDGVERWSPTAGWRRAAPMDEPRAHHSALRLADGRVMVVTGCQPDPDVDAGWRPVLFSSRSSIYDPRTDRWVPGPAGPRTCRSMTAELPDHRFLLAGGCCTCGGPDGAPWCDVLTGNVAPPDAGPPDTGRPDASPPIDIGTPDVGREAGGHDAGVELAVDTGASSRLVRYGCGCTVPRGTRAGGAGLLLLAALVAGRRTGRERPGRRLASRS